MKERKGFLYYFVRNRNGMIGMIGVLLILLIGLVGPMLIAKPDGYTQDILQAPSALHWLGTDNIGLDIFCRTGLGCSHLAVRFRYGYAHCRRDRHTGGPAVRL